MTELTELN